MNTLINQIIDYCTLENRFLRIKLEKEIKFKYCFKNVESNKRFIVPTNGKNEKIIGMNGQFNFII